MNTYSTFLVVEVFGMELWLLGIIIIGRFLGNYIMGFYGYEGERWVLELRGFMGILIVFVAVK
jgi:hypothetical protein